MKRELRAEIGGAQSGANAHTDRPDAQASRRGDRYVWARLEGPDGALELTLWRDGRWVLEHLDPRFTMEGGTLPVEVAPNP